MDAELFADECRFAKLVRVGAGHAILVGGLVFFVHGPSAEVAEDVHDATQDLYAEWFVTALRRSAPFDPMQAQGIMSKPAAP